jgi:RND family efflux transporter MFP subunit
MSGPVFGAEKKELLKALERPDIPAARMGNTRRGLLVLLLACIGVAAWAHFFAADKPSAAATPAPPAAPPSAAHATAAAIDTLTASGYVVARRQATVSSEISGSLAEVLVEEGAHVAKGQLVARLDSTLARLDQEVLRTSLLASEAAARAAAARAKEAKRNLDRQRALSERGFVGEAQVTAAETDATAAVEAQAQAEVQSTAVLAQLKRQQALLAKYEVVAPFAGVVTGVSAQVGEIVAPGSASGGFTRTGICTIVDMDSLELDVEVNESYISRVTPGQRVRVTLDAYPGWTIPASVIAVVPSANRSRGTVRVRIGLLEKDSRILPDMAAKVTFLRGAEPRS